MRISSRRIEIRWSRRVLANGFTELISSASSIRISPCLEGFGIGQQSRFDVLRTATTSSTWIRRHLEENVGGDTGTCRNLGNGPRCGETSVVHYRDAVTDPLDVIQEVTADQHRGSEVMGNGDQMAENVFATGRINPQSSS